MVTANKEVLAKVGDDILPPPQRTKPMSILKAVLRYTLIMPLKEDSLLTACVRDGDHQRHYQQILTKMTEEKAPSMRCSNRRKRWDTLSRSFFRCHG